MHISSQSGHVLQQVMCCVVWKNIYTTTVYVLHFYSSCSELNASSVIRATQTFSVSSNNMSWPTDASGYALSQMIGSGSFSSVWRAEVLADRSMSGEVAGRPAQVAIKIMDLENIGTSFDDILQEVQTMRLCDDKNVLRCYCSFVHSSQLWLITQCMDRGSCLRVMTIASEELGLGKGLSEESVAYILRETLQGLHYLHINGQIHRDIKCGNILLDSEGSVRVADFGVSGWTLSRGQRHETVRTFVGTPCWMAPEVMEQVDGYDHRADIWSVGITALELAKVC